VLWDNDDIVTTSLNWGSASPDDRFPQADVGVHIHAPGRPGRDFRGRELGDKFLVPSPQFQELHRNLS
jgi:hypothetical protein